MTTVHKQMAKGAAWMVLFKFVERSIGLVSTIILARLLVPEDFGLVALAMAVILLVELLGAFNFDMVLIQKQHSDRSYYDTAWTFNVIVGVGSALVLYLIAQPMAAFYNDPRLAPVIQMLALAPLLDSFQNIGVVAFRKEMQFHKEFAFLLVKKLTAFTITLVLAFTWHNYWALIAGIVAGRVAATALSYWVHPFRPRFSVARRAELFSFSFWLFLTNVANFISHRVPDFVIGKVAGPHTLGLYSVAYEISNLPTTELVAPINRAVFPGYSKMSDQLSALREGYSAVIRLVALFLIPAALGIAATASVFVPLVLGDKWVEAIPLIEVLAFYGALLACEGNAGSVYIAQGAPRLNTIIVLGQNLIRIPALIYGVAQAGALGAAIGILCAALVTLPVNLAIVFRRLEMGAADALAIFLRPVAGSVVMYLGVTALKAELGVPHGFFATVLTLLALVICGALLYGGIVFILWLATGRQAGAETTVITQLRTRLKLAR